MAAPGPSSYAELFASLPDVLDGTYQQLLAPFDAAGPETPANLRNSILATSGEVPKVFLCTVDDPPVVRVIHHPTKFAPTLGLTSNRDNEVFAFASDVGDGNQVTLIYWPDNAFTRTVQVHVPTVAAMEAQFVAATGADCAGPYAAGDADTEELQTWLIFPVPPPYVEFVMQWQMFTPRQLWSDLVSLVIADGRAADCSLQIDLACVACNY